MGCRGRVAGASRTCRGGVAGNSCGTIAITHADGGVADVSRGRRGRVADVLRTCRGRFADVSQGTYDLRAHTHLGVSRTCRGSVADVLRGTAGLFPGLSATCVWRYIYRFVWLHVVEVKFYVRCGSQAQFVRRTHGLVMAKRCGEPLQSESHHATCVRILSHMSIFFMASNQFC